MGGKEGEREGRGGATYDRAEAMQPRRAKEGGKKKRNEARKGGREGGREGGKEGGEGRTSHGEPALAEVKVCTRERNVQVRGCDLIQANP